MLPKSKRLNKEDFKRARPKVFFRGDVFDASLFLSPIRKYACVITKKRVKTAVARNMLKRKVLTAVREMHQETTKQEKDYIIFYIKAIPKETSYTLIKEEIRKAFDTLH